MLRQIKFELFKMFKRPRTYLGFVAFLAINFCVLMGMKYGGVNEMAAGQALANGFQVVGSLSTAEMMAWVVVASDFSGPILTMFLPFFIYLVFGEMVSGESSEGTLRAMLTRPISRGKLFGAQFMACLIYAAALVGFVGVSAYIMGWITFGRGGLMSIGSFEHPMLTYFDGSQALCRLAAAYCLTILSMTAVGMIAFFISTWLNNSMGAIGGAIMLLFAMVILGALSYFKPIHQYLLSTHLMVGKKVFFDPIPWREIHTSVLYIGAYIVVLFTASMLIFRRKDILT